MKFKQRKRKLPLLQKKNKKKKTQPTYKELGAIVNKKNRNPNSSSGSPPNINILNMPLLFNFDEVTN